MVAALEQTAVATSSSPPTSVWSSSKHAFGIVKCVFDQEDKPHRLSLDVGDTVIILKETTHWYYGHRRGEKEHRGIFPKTYIHLADYTIVNGEYCIKRTEIVEEITKVLLEWGIILKQQFLTNHPDVAIVREKMTDLIHTRAMLISGNLPSDETRTMQLQAASLIDTGNNLLGLDMVVRDENGEILNTTTIATTELYEYHVNAVSRIIKANRPHATNRHSREMNKYSHNILLQVNAFICKFQDEADLLFTLFDGEAHKPISENYLVKWSRTGSLDHMDQNCVLFTDLSRNDLALAKLYLVCYAVRVGSMELKESDSRRASMSANMLSPSSKKNSQLSISSNSSFSGSEYSMRRPFGVACKDLAAIIQKAEDCRSNLDMPFIMCEKENLDGTLKKLMANKDICKFDSKIPVTIEVLQGDIKQIKEDFPRLVNANMPLARKMGFPEVIFPGDVRNDLYLTLCFGEFARIAKTSEKNVEVSVCVCNEQGQVVPGVMSVGAGYPPVDEYKSVVYYHDDKPKWQETFKIHVPIDEFKQCHLKFMFKHRSSNEQKDKSEKPFGLSYVKLMQANGTTITQGQHNLAVYKVDHKKFDKSSASSYLSLPSSLVGTQHTKVAGVGLTLLPKDQMVISVNLCSTKLTQSVSLLGLLNWSAHKETLECSLNALSDVPGEEVVKFLQDILDALFNILVENDDPERYDQLVFMSIIHLIEIVTDLKYQHFLTVLDVYINDSFSATLAYSKLIDVLHRTINAAIHPSELPSDCVIETDERIEVKRLYKTTRYLHYIMKFIIRSRILFSAINGDSDYDDFANRLHELLNNFTEMIASPSNLLKSEGALLKNLHIIATDLMQIFDPVRLSLVVVNILERFPAGRLTQSKMVCIKDFVDSKLFCMPECRAILLPVFCKHIHQRLENKEEGDSKSDIWQQEKNLSKAAKVLGQLKSQLHTRETTAKQKVAECISIMNNILKLLHRRDIGPTHNDIRDIMLILLRTVIKTSHALDRENHLVGNLYAIMLGILQRMDKSHYDLFVRDFQSPYDLRDFIIEILLVFEELVSPHQKSVFPSDWMDMIMHQNTVILRSLQHLSAVIICQFFDDFEKQVWSNFFQCSIAFLIQTPLQLHDFNDNKRQVIFARYRDLRKDTADEIRKMWFQLGEHKPKFVPQLVEPILEMSMIPEVELRRTTIPIFFDMMQCEYYSSRLVCESYGDTKRNNAHYKGNFYQFETEMIEKLDILIGAGKGDAEYRDLFEQIMMEMCRAHTCLCTDGTKFVSMVTRLIDRLLEYRCIIQDESKENRMACTFSLLQFYSEVNRKEMYIRYVYKLFDLQMEFQNFTEAAHTLTLHTELLEWTDAELPPLLRSHRHLACRSHRELKETLYYDIIDYFDKGKMWESAIAMCKVLWEQYEKETLDYLKLAGLLRKMAEYFQNIVKEMRHPSEYYRVAFYGLGFPRFLQNKDFIFRGKAFERLEDFSKRIRAQHPRVEVMRSLETPGPDITESDGQYVQINSVVPIMDEAYKSIVEKTCSKEIIKYLTTNNVQRFRFSRPYREGDGDDVSNMWLERTEMTIQYPLPGVLRWYPVVDVKKSKISPLEFAIETMVAKNKELRDIIIEHRGDENLALQQLSMKISGIVDPAVMGGSGKYESAFLNDEYLEQHPDQYGLIADLKDLIASQIPLLDLALQLHRQKMPDDLKPFHELLEKRFADMRLNIESKYGKKSCDVKLERDSVIMRRNGFLPMPDGTNRLSETSMGSSDSGLSKSTSRVTSASIMSQLPNIFTARSTLTYSPSTKSKKKRNTFKKQGERETLSLPVTTWYASNLSTINATPEKEVNTSITSASNTSLAGSKTPDPMVLTQELTTERPSRPDKNKGRLSRPASIATPTASMKGYSIADSPHSLSGAESSNRNSMDTTDSTASEEDLRPPPLPAKTRDSTDFSSLTHGIDWNGGMFALNNFTTISSSSSTMTSTKNNSITNTTYEYVEAKNFAITDDRRRPPTPPPKPSRNSKHIPNDAVQ